MDIYVIITDVVIRFFKEVYQVDVPLKDLQVQNTRKEFNGDFTLVVFPFLRITKKSPEKSAEEIGDYLTGNTEEIESFNVIKGFLNLVVACAYWEKQILDIYGDKEYGMKSPGKDSPLYMIEYSSPNTNKPLHLGHIRNNLIGYSLSMIMEANGKQVRKVNLVNDRGIHICKSMLAWKNWGNKAE